MRSYEEVLRDCPCKDCEERAIGCHARWRKYRHWGIIFEETKLARKKENDIHKEAWLRGKEKKESRIRKEKNDK